MITLDNLTVQQQVLCQLLWDCDSVDQVTQLIQSLPQRWQQQALGLQQLMIQEHIEQQQPLPDITDLLQKYNIKK